MKTLFNLTMLVSLSIISFPSLSATIIAIGGNWSSAASWNLARVPTCGDVIVIPAGVTINISSNVNLDGSGCAPITIQCLGNITFSNGKKIRLGTGGCMQISITGTVSPSGSGGGSSELIEIDGVDWWKASDGTLLGSSVSGGVNLGCAVLLPIQLTNFSAQNRDETVSLNWSLASINPDSYFQIERSKDGNSWEKLDTIKALPNTETYQLLDDFPHFGLTYYRLSIYNIDGQKSTLGTIANERQVTSYLVYPNPAKDKVFLVGEDIKNAKVKVLNSLGETINTQQSLIENEYCFDFHTVKSGIYFLQIENKNEIKTERIMINNQE